MFDRPVLLCHIREKFCRNYCISLLISYFQDRGFVLSWGREGKGGALIGSWALIRAFTVSLSSMVVGLLELETFDAVVFSSALLMQPVL